MKINDQTSSANNNSANDERFFLASTNPRIIQNWKEGCKIS